MTKSTKEENAVPDPADRKSTSDFVRYHIGWMLRLARCYVSDPSLAEDVVQNTFSNVFARRDQFRGDASVKTWVRSILVNEALTILRKRTALKEEGVMDELMPEFDEYACRIESPWSGVPTSEQLLISKQVNDLVMRAIDELPTGYRIVLLLRDIEELSTTEVAKRLDISEANVKTRLHRARAALKTLLEPHMRKGGL